MHFLSVVSPPSFHSEILHRRCNNHWSLGSFWLLTVCQRAARSLTSSGAKMSKSHLNVRNKNFCKLLQNIELKLHSDVLWVVLITGIRFVRLNKYKEIWINVRNMKLIEEFLGMVCVKYMLKRIFSFQLIF